MSDRDERRGAEYLKVRRAEARQFLDRLLNALELIITDTDHKKKYQIAWGCLQNLKTLVLYFTLHTQIYVLVFFHNYYQNDDELSEIAKWRQFVGWTRCGPAFRGVFALN